LEDSSREIIITLVPAETPVNLIVTITNPNGNILETATLTHAGTNVERGVGGTFTITARASNIGDMLVAAAPNFNPANHEITSANLTDGEIFISLAPISAIPGTSIDDEQGDGMSTEGATVSGNYHDPLLIPSLITGEDTNQHIHYLTGFPDNTVRPDSQLTRAQAAMIFFRLLDDGNKYTPVAAGRFSDVDGVSWYSQAINYLAQIGILLGYPDGTFRPNAPVTRAEFSAMISRFFRAFDAAPNNFTDVSASHWAARYIDMASSRGWVQGYGDGTFRPDNAITRAEVVTLVNRAIDRVPNPATIRDSLDGRMIYTDITPAHWAFYDIMEASIEHTFVRDASGLEIWTWYEIR
jgi:hypothetical protein